METTTYDSVNASWNETRSSEKLDSFVSSKLASLVDIDLGV